MIKILRKILMVQDEVIRCPYWESGKCTAVDYPLNCNYQAGFIQCSKYLEVRVKEIGNKDSQQTKPNTTTIKDGSGIYEAKAKPLTGDKTADTHTLLGKVIPKDILKQSPQSQDEARRYATGRIGD